MGVSTARLDSPVQLPMDGARAVARQPPSIHAASKTMNHEGEP